MKFIDKFLQKRGYVKLRKKRSYAAASISRLTEGWTITNQTADAEIKASLKVMRARSRELAINNDYAKKFLKMVIANVVGINGIMMQNKAKEFDGKTLDKSANDKIETTWKEWGQKGNCTVDGRLSWRDTQKLTVLSTARDGEILIRKVKGFKNKFGFALQLIEADHLDENYNLELSNGNFIRMGVEFNKWYRPVAYHVLAKHPGDYSYQSISGQRYERIPAVEIIHLFIQDRPTQSRGVPWMHSAMTRLNMLGGYEEAELVAARVAAAKMGIIKTPTGSEYVGEDKDSEGNVITEADPGAFEQIPPGWDFTMFDPKHPAGNFGPFMKVVLRGAASGLNVAYNTFSNDLEGVNFSSIRSGVLEERDQWRMLQGWLIEHLCIGVFKDWLDMAMLTKTVDLPIAKFDKFNASKWQGRGWAWVDPLKDQKANTEAIHMGVKTRSMVVAEQGLDLEDVFEQLKTEKELAQKYGLEFKEPKEPGGFKSLEDVENLVEDLIEQHMGDDGKK